MCFEIKPSCGFDHFINTTKFYVNKSSHPTDTIMQIDYVIY